MPSNHFSAVLRGSFGYLQIGIHAPSPCQIEGAVQAAVAIMGVDGLAIDKARAARRAAIMVRIFMGFLASAIGWSSFFTSSSRLAGLLMTDAERVSLAG
jgi:hypothetical protein